MKFFSRDTLTNEKKVMPKNDKMKISPLVKTSKSTTQSELSAPVSSNKLLTEYRTFITIFQGFTGTKPVHELINSTWDEVKNRMCSNIPTVLSDKKKGEYFVPCALKVAPFVGNTLERAKNNGEPLIGKMRSKSHITDSNLLVVDVDGIHKEISKNGRLKLKKSGITYLIYTTYSHGSAEKPGARYRIIIPLDRSLPQDEYEKAWRGFDEYFFEGHIGKEDASSSKIYQQQGTWCCHPDRRNKAKRIGCDAGIASADFLLGKGHDAEELRITTKPEATKLELEKAVVPPRINSKYGGASSSYPISDAEKVAESCYQIAVFRDNKGAGQSEPLWRDCLGIVGYCENGERICHDWSSGHAGYDKTETDRKIQYRIQVAPTTCGQFQKTNPEGCRGCTQICHSPITLGWLVKDELSTIQLQFALLNMDGKIWIVDGGSLRELTEQGVARRLALSTIQDGRLPILRAITSQFPQADAEKIFKEFLTNPNTVCYRGVEFNPKGTSGKYLNLWVGPTVNPKQGQWNLIEEFLLKIICDGDETAYHYLVKYIAHALQRPEEKPGVMIILIGGQGTGKGTFGRILQRIWSATYIQINNIDNITGNFNAMLERCFFVFLDEALFSGNRRSSDALKSIVTETIIQINEKYQPSRQIKSYHRFIAATNADHFKNTERDDRRDFTLRVSEERKGDFEYWDKLNNEIENGGVEALAYDLLALDISDFTVRNKPDTEELQAQKLMSLDTFAAWWHGCLEEGTFSETNGSWESFIGTKEIIEKINEVTGGKFYKKPTPQTIAKDIAKVCPSAVKRQKQDNFQKVRGYALPDLAQARAEFEEYIGDAINWGGEIEIYAADEATEGNDILDDRDLFLE